MIRKKLYHLPATNNIDLSDIDSKEINDQMITIKEESEEKIKYLSF